MGNVSILNVAAGDLSLTFDKNNPVETIRAARVCRDMLRRGYALLIEVERDGKKAYERALDFREDICCYVIADYDHFATQALTLTVGEWRRNRLCHPSGPAARLRRRTASAAQVARNPARSGTVPSDL